MSGATVIINGKARNVKELKYSQNGTAMLSWSCAIPYKDKDGETVFDWYNLTLFGNSAENLAGKIEDGTRFLAYGTPQISLFEKDDGTVNGSIRVSVFRFEFSGDKPQDDDDSSHKKPAQKSGGKPTVRKTQKQEDDDDPGF